MYSHLNKLTDVSSSLFCSDSPLYFAQIRLFRNFVFRKGLPLMSMECLHG